MFILGGPGKNEPKPLNPHETIRFSYAIFTINMTITFKATRDIIIFTKYRQNTPSNLARPPLQVILDLHHNVAYLWVISTGYSEKIYPSQLKNAAFLNY